MTQADTASAGPSDAPGPGADLDGALSRLLARLDGEGYDFRPPTPATHARVVQRRGEARTLRDAFGWSLPFRPGLLPADLMADLEAANLLEARDGAWRSRVRVSRLEGVLFLHSAYPTQAEDAVFLGPDSYRFARLIAAALDEPSSVGRILDLGAGAGVGGLVAGALRPGASVVLADVNPWALRLARINAAHAGRAVETVVGDVAGHPPAEVDLALANPPFMQDADARTYRDGGDMHGARLSLDWALGVAPRLAPGGRMILYTGSAIVDGRDALREALEQELPALGCTLSYQEIDIDIFGEELERPAYRDVERIAAVGAVIDRRA